MAAEGGDIELGLRNGSAGPVNGHDYARLGRNSPPTVVRSDQIVLQAIDFNVLSHTEKGDSAVCNIERVTVDS